MQTAKSINLTSVTLKNDIEKLLVGIEVPTEFLTRLESITYNMDDLLRLIHNNLNIFHSNDINIVGDYIYVTNETDIPKHEDEEDNDGYYSTIHVYIDKNVYYHYSNGKLDSKCNEPTIYTKDRTYMDWFRNGVRKRGFSRLPNIIVNGNQYWTNSNEYPNAYFMFDGQEEDMEYHREGNQPAIIRIAGEVEYLVNNKRHRDNDRFGKPLPAVIYPSGKIKYHNNGQRFFPNQNIKLPNTLYDSQISKFNDRCIEVFNSIDINFILSFKPHGINHGSGYEYNNINNLSIYQLNILFIHENMDALTNKYNITFEGEFNITVKLGNQKICYYYDNGNLINTSIK